MIKIVLTSLLVILILVLGAQTTVSKSWSGSLTVDAGSGNPPSVTFTSGVDFPAGTVIESITASVSFSKVDNTCASPGAGNPFNEEIRFIVRGPGSLPTSNRRLIDFNDFTSTTNGGAVTMTFPGASALPTFPTTGTYSPDQALTAYHQESPFGSWFIRGRDNVADDPLCYTGYTISITGNWPLPVEFNGVSLKKISSTQNKIEWSTSSELNADKFILQKNIDGEKWINIAETKAAGTSNETQHYWLEDNNSRDDKEEYYRIAQVDFDGTTSYTKVLIDEAVEQDKAPNVRLKVWGNTGLESELMVEFVHASLFNRLTLYTPSGKQVLLQELKFDDKSVIMPLNLNQLETGIYVLVVTTLSGQRLSQKIAHRQQ
jgi:hypothetical protein